MTNTISGMLDIAAIPSLQKCARCGSPNIIAILEIETEMNDLPVTKLYPTCGKCAEETNTKLPSNLPKVVRYPRIKMGNEE